MATSIGRTSLPASSLARAAALSVALLLAALAPVNAASGLRDAEIERRLRDYTNPILQAAGLSPEAVNLYLLNDSSLNAFVANGQNIYFHSGLIMALESPNELIGVIAHETGHIAGGHLLRGRDAYENASVPVVFSMLLAVAAVAAGAPDAGIGILAGGQTLAQRTALAYSRGQESAADQAGLSFLNATGQSGRGMLAVFERFSDQELLSARRQDPFARSHPMSRERLAALRERAEASPYFNIPETPQAQLNYDLIRAKLQGFIDRPDITLRRYPASDKSLPARYARAVAYFRLPDPERAIAEIKALVALVPDNGYFHELEGQLLTEGGDPEAGVAAYERAVALLPKEPLIRTSLAGAMLATEDPSLIAPARDHLLAAIREDSDNPSAWRYLAMAYEQLGDTPRANLASAEQFFAIRNYKRAYEFAARAKDDLEGPTEIQRAQDIIEIARTEEAQREH
ncbi:MAG: M48 family metalloprotease [Alphaproteobacteria bacterium]|nr:M48 family metalloprotease [Alphaproteobacteria bacterium]